MLIVYLKKIINNSLKALLVNKKRSFLTMLGIIIGVASVIVIMSIGTGAQSLILSQIESMGSNTISIMPGKSEEKGPPASVFGISITTLTYEDGLALLNKNNVSSVYSMVAFLSSSATLSWLNNSCDSTIYGSNPDIVEFAKLEISNGRFYTNLEDENMARVIVLGSNIKDELFGQADAVGKVIRVKDNSFEVIGVLKKKGSVGFSSYDDQAFIPVKSMQKLIMGVEHVSLIRVKANTEKDVPMAMEEIAMTLRERHDITDKTGASDDFTISSAADAMKMVKTITDALKLFLIAMASLSLLVGGIGIMNIMLIRVTERTREIGLRKAVGAKNKDILMQFLVESSTITIFGGVIGIIIGVIVSFVISVIAQKMNYDWPFSVSILAIFLATLVSLIVGLIFGIYPAKKASHLEPIEALRYE